MARAAYEYTKSVLEKVSFNAYLFCKELKKALQQLLPHEVYELSIWLETFVENKPELRVCMVILDGNKAIPKR